MAFYDVQMTKMINSGISRYFIKLFLIPIVLIFETKAGIFWIMLSVRKTPEKEQSLLIGMMQTTMSGEREMPISIRYIVTLKKIEMFINRHMRINELSELKIF